MFETITIKNPKHGLCHGKVLPNYDIIYTVKKALETVIKGGIFENYDSNHYNQKNLKNCASQWKQT